MMDITDTDASGKSIYDVDSGMILPDFFTTDRKLLKREAARKAQIEKESETKLKKTGVVLGKFSDTEGIDIGITELLAKHKLEKK